MFGAAIAYDAEPRRMLLMLLRGDDADALAYDAVSKIPHIGLRV